MVCVNQLVDQSRSLYVPVCPWYDNDTKIIKHAREHNLGHTRRGVDKNKEGLVFTDDYLFQYINQY